MITVQEAKKIIGAHPVTRKKEHVPLDEALGLVLAAPVRAQFDSPLFDNAAMDGYAVRVPDTREAGPHSMRELKVVEEIRAGDRPKRSIRHGETARIMTGAMLPRGANAVVMRERTIEENGYMRLEDETRTGENIRRRGEEIRRGATALEAGTLLTPAAAAFLKSVGVEKAPVFVPPAVGILVTGSELATRPDDLKPGWVLETNSLALKGGLWQAGIQQITVEKAGDRLRELLAAAKRLLQRCDVLFISGGISVGHWDFTREVLKKCGVQTLFWRVAQKPGKPLFFGAKEKKIVFGLPGNPASALTCFYEYAWPSLRRALGSPRAELPSLIVPAETAGAKKKGVSLFLRGEMRQENGHPTVRLLNGQESFRMGSFAQANCLAVFPEETAHWEAGDSVEVHLLP